MRRVAARGRAARRHRARLRDRRSRPTAADINACRPSQQCFIDEIWPNFLAKDGYPNGVHCYDAACHGALAPNALDMIVPTTPGYPSR